MATESSVLQGTTMSDAEISRLLTDRGVGVLSLADGDVPYGVPLSFGYDGDDRLYFLFAGHSEAGKKVRYAEQSAEASFLVFEVTANGAWRSAIVSGPLERITPTEWDAAREAMADNAYRPDLLTDVDVRSDPRVWALGVADASGRSMGDA
jgi:hypothetical protein